ncbi:MAG: ATP-binding protein [Pseudomonadota bacterium]
MADDLNHLIESASARARRRDFLMLFVGLAALLIGLWLFGGLPAPAAAAGLAIAALGFVLRYRAASARIWFRPVERLVEEELARARQDGDRLQRLSGVLDELSDPLFLLDETDRVDYANLAAQDYVGGDPAGRHVSAVVRAPEVLSAIEDAVAGAPPQLVDFEPPGAVERVWRASVRCIEDQEDHRTLVSMRDLTTERRLERMRVDFIANASHELRTPLSSVLGFIETLRGHAKEDPGAQERFLSIMQGQAERMGRLIEDLLSLSRIELNEHVPPNAVVDALAASHDVVDSLSPLAAANGARIEISDRTSGASQIVGDRDEIIQVVQNLVDNAIKYGDGGRPIEVILGLGAPPALDPAAIPDVVHHAGDYLNQVAARAGAQLEDYLHVQVRDRGDGIQRSDLPRLTERFYRVDDATSRERGGTGLGLAIVKHIVNRHRGAFEVESALGKGSAFTVSFRRAGPGVSAEAAE